MTANPLATEAQRRIEDRAMALLQRPDMQRARAMVTLLWQNVAAWPSRDQADRFANMIDEYMFHHAFRAANGDANHPEVARFMAPPHRWFGRDVPGSRWGGDSPDFIYRTIPIAHGGRYEIRGKPTCDEAPTVNYSLMADNTASPVTQTLLDSLNMDFASDGSFAITVDDTPADGRRNHIQTKPGADFIMVRDALGDWLGQSSNALTVTRLDPAGDPKSADDMARHCARIALDNVYYTYYCTRSGAGQAPNAIRPPMSSAAFGGMATQAGTKGNLVLEEGDALIVRSNAAGALFRNVTLTDAFHMSIEYWKRTSSFNMRQMAPDEDGNFTFVIAHRDPGIHNWLDTGGLRRCIFGQRWQAFQRDGQNDEPWMHARQVKFDRLEHELPDGVQRIDSLGRHEQIMARETGFARRFAEG
ncbi:MAG: hypothetical protein LBV50_07750 [Novosphingobium sp.]|jgi:hypothetical protein|nr:hypothetical protein [Novosphingobium sp.]